jgi:hypothetical protein|tara:strand:- start:375 stop:809 length:435 start_codon:yes stop_codon:yes gene_type:complete
MSTSLYETFGSEINYKFTAGKLEAYLENASVKFPLPEASSEILADLAKVKELAIDPQKLDVIKTKLVAIGFSLSNANAMAKVLIQIAKVQDIDPTAYFDMNADTLKLSVDAFEAMNAVRPAGNKVDIKNSIDNSRSKAATLIKA